MDGVKVALGDRGMTVEAEQQKSRYIFGGKIRLRYIVVKSLLMSTQFISPRYDG